MKTDSISLKEEVAITEYDAQLQIKSTCCNKTFPNK